MNVDDFASLLMEGFPPHLCKLQHHQGVSVLDFEAEDDFHMANFVAQVCECHRVEYIDGNPFNLREDNLRVVPSSEATDEQPTH